MPPSTRLATPGPSNAPKGSKRTMLDADSAPQDSKKARRNPSVEPSTRRDSSRDTKRRRKRKKKAPIVGSGVSKSDTTQNRWDECSRAPLSARNEIIRFTSAPPGADLPAGIVHAAQDSSPRVPSLKSLGKVREDSSLIPETEVMPSSPRPGKRASPVNNLLESSCGSLEERVAQLEAKLKSQNTLIVSHQALLNQVQQAVTCQVCLDLMYKAYALAPCGHLACHGCLVNWFTAPPSDNRQAPPAIRRKKTCPHCRAVVRNRPVEVWGVKSVAQAMGKSGLLPNQLPVPDEAPESLDVNADPWEDIFPKPGSAAHRRFPWLYPDVDDDNDDIHGADFGPRGEDVGMLDVEDGGIYRCLDCMHEIWDGVCSSCRRVYPGHRPEGNEEDDEGDALGWIEDQMGAEEVDMDDDPGWMGLEEGEADDGGDMDDWRPFSPWRRQFHMFRGPWGFLGTIHVDEEGEEDDDEDSLVDDLRDLDEGDDSGDEGYESSFIDDEEDEGGGNAEFVDGPRIYEIDDDDEDGDYLTSRRHSIVDLDSDEHGEDEHGEHGAGERGWAADGRVLPTVTSDEEIDEAEDDIAYIRQHLARRQRVESDSDAY